MSLTCTRCGGSGFLNDYAAPENAPQMENEELQEWCLDNPDEDFQVCDCCGDGEDWYGVPGEHYNIDDPPGHDGPYDYNGGYCECH